MNSFPHIFLQTPWDSLNKAWRSALGDIYGNIIPYQNGLLTEPQPCILAGLVYVTPWTRDTAINVWNGCGWLCPSAARNTLLSVLARDDEGVYIGGQYWDAIIWLCGAWAYYLMSGDKPFLETALQAGTESLRRYEQEERDQETGLFRGPACYGDGIAAYPDIYARTGPSSGILQWPEHNPELAALRGYGIVMQTLSTNCLYVRAYQLINAIRTALDLTPQPEYDRKARDLTHAIREQFWMPRQQRFRYLIDPFGGCDHMEGLGHSFAILFGIADQQQTQAVFQNQHITPAGLPCVWPSFERYQIDDPNDYGRHSGPVWPHVQGFWAEAAARHRQTDIFTHELRTLTEHIARDGHCAELYHPDTGQIYGGLQEMDHTMTPFRSCVRQTWSATAVLRMVIHGLLGITFEQNGLTFQPLIPAGLSPLHLQAMPYRDMSLNISVTGTGSQISSFTVNGQKHDQPFISAQQTGTLNINLEVE